ncbi:MAG: carboxypeptidase-like regulatory domain-containing protein [Bacteroidetes bacterium]|jgi:outer membrane receptor protein involved in Fe transport|nr:carboxypeptidase-like regulatory domain-containing protein [Bacteroidota bacterium]
MLKNLLLTLCIVLTSWTLALAQQGRLQGKVYEKDSKEPIPFANIVLENGGTVVGGATSDFDGNYVINPIPPGKYDLKATFVGYNPVTITGINIPGNKITFYDIEMSGSSINLETVEIIEYKVPLISKDKTASGASVTSEEIKKMPNRSADAVAATVGGVFSQDGERGNVRGARSDATAVYIDGVRVIGSGSVPQSAIEQVDVILGGTPAQYGDATGGIISVTTKGPSRKFGAGVELETSEMLDAYGHNRLGFNVQGPLLKSKKNETALLGFFIAGDINYNRDGRISGLGYYRANDATLSSISDNPLRPSGTGTGTFRNGEFVRMGDLVSSKTSMNTARYGVNLSGNINIRTTETINLSVGGTFNKTEGDAFRYSASFFNYDKNTRFDNNTWRVFGRFTQRFPTDNESTSIIKNIYYSIQADYTRENNYYGDPNHWDDVFKYGYLGKYEVYKTPTFELGSDTVNGQAYNDVWVLNSWDFDTLVSWTPSDINPLVANYTSSYYDTYAGQPEDHYENFSQIQLGGGLLNGDSPSAFYGLYQAPGTNQSGYGFDDNDQFSINVNGSMDIGNHEIRLGFQYEQRTSRSVAYAPTGMWSLMRGLTNFHINELDKDNPFVIGYDGIVDTIMYYRRYDGQSQRTFDANLREKLGLAVDGLDYINIDSYDFNNNTIDYYDKDGNLHTITANGELFDLSMFSPDELLNDGNYYTTYSGYDYTGNKLTSKPSFEDFFTERDENGMFTRPIGAFQPVYIAGYLQDKFAFRDLIFNIGVRVDRFDANQQVLNDPYLLFNARTAGEVTSIKGQTVNHPASIEGDYVVYVDKVNDPTRIVGYRNENTWFNAEGAEIQDPTILDAGSGISPYLFNPDQNRVDITSFKDYEPQVNVMPRISFSFPISDEALFFAHYDVLTQRPTSNLFSNPATYYFFENIGSVINNPSLRPSQTIDYELGFTQKLTNSSSITFTSFYREMRDMIQIFRFNGAYPKDYTSFNNLDFGTVKGMTVEYDLRRTNNARLRASYTLQFANATGASTTTAAALVAAGLPNLRSTIAMPWDRRHQFNVLFDYRYGKGKEYNGPVIRREKKDKAPVQILNNTGFSLTVTGGSGTPYTASRNVISPISGGSQLLRGTYFGSRLPWQFRLDLRVDKDIDLNLGSKDGEKRMAYLNVYLQVLNLLDTKNVLGVYSATGNPDDDGYLSAPEWQRQINNQTDPIAFRELYSVYVNAPGNYSSPRQIRVGVLFNF